ncbi:MAG: hypothetical protein CSA36_01600 [Draconibacterium sp.]|nr:MAG: hypothetical protein CSA36_01600 [Draconibacterium sp.]
MLNFIFYRLYLFFDKQKYRKNPASKASGLVGGLMLLNVYTILSIVKTNLMNYTINSFLFILIAILTIVLASLIFNSKRLSKLVEKYSTFTKRELMIRRMVGYIYIILSIILFFKYMVNLTG